MADTSQLPDMDEESLLLKWTGAIIGAFLVGCTGVFPLLIIPDNVGSKSTDKTILNALLGFAVGGLLGDVFLHLLPEVYGQIADKGTGELGRVGWSVIIGILVFLVLEKVLESSNPETDETKKDADKKKVLGYLNLLANSTDNLLHGLAVGTSFLSSTRLGMTTTFAILIHEIPHEFGDFAILLNSGFNRWDAAKAQMTTALLGMIGALAALALEASSDLDAFLQDVLPFTAGGFLNIALVTVLPGLMQESRPFPLFLQLICCMAGLLTMQILTDF